MTAHFRRLAAYNCWANERLYEAVGRLSPAAFAAPRVGFFPSIARTLNHLLLVDLLWMGRLDGGDTKGITRLDQQLHADFDSLRAARRATDARLIAYVGGLDDAALASAISYRTTSGEPQVMPCEQMLSHLFNHQTHHRGQVHAMLSSTPVAPPPLDLLFFLRQQPAMVSRH